MIAYTNSVLAIIVYEVEPAINDMIKSMCVSFTGNGTY